MDNNRNTKFDKGEETRGHERRSVSPLRMITDTTGSEASSLKTAAEQLTRLDWRTGSALGSRDTSHQIDIDEYFKDQFVSLLDSISLSDLPSSFNRHIPIKDVRNMYGPEKAIAYAAARGLTLLKKAEQTPWKDTTEAFKKRYDVKVDRLWISDDAAKDFIVAKVYVKNPVHGIQLPAYARHCYENELSPVEGKLNLTVNYGERDNDFKLPGTDRLNLSHILWHCRAEAIAELANWDVKVSNSNPITELTLERVINSDASDVWDLLKPAFSGTERVELKKGGKYYNAFIGTPVSVGVLYFCEQYKHEIGAYEVKEIVIPDKGKDLQKVHFHFGPKNNV